MSRIRAALSRATRDDSGIAIVITMAIAMMVAVLIVVVAAVAIHESNASGRDRQRSAAVMTAEGQVDSLVGAMTGTSASSLPCGSLPAANQTVGPDSLSFTRTVSYFAADNSPITDCAGVQAGTVKAASAKIVVTSVSGRLAGQAPARRTVETLLNLSPVFKNQMDKAIYGEAGVSASGNLSVTSSSKTADVYTNGDFACNGNETYQGNLTAQGNVTMQNSCTVVGDVRAKLGLTGSNGHPTIGGKVEVAQGDASLGGIYISGVGAAKSSGATSGDACSTAGTCVSGATLSPPPVEPFPQLLKANEIAGFVGQGYTQVNVADPIAWLIANGATMTSDTLLVTTNRVSMSTPGTQLLLNRNVAILADGGFDIQKAKNISSTTTATRNLYFIQPYDAVSTHPCSSDYGVQINNLVTMDATIDDLVYTPCNVYKANHGVHQGQVYGGGTVTLGNNTSLAFVLLPVWGVTYTTPIIDHYATNIVYTRENLG
ncbi:MAG TPA: hypothetical protein VIH37_04650 [Candidatus Limnocylindrales bacterium]